MKKGFTVLYAILVASLLLSISLGIYSISLRDFILSSSASESEKAIFAADSGVECALYWDRVRHSFASPGIAASNGFSAIAVNPATIRTIYCGETSRILYDPNVGSTLEYSFSNFNATEVGWVTQFIVRFTPDNNAPCALVVVYKRAIDSTATVGPSIHTRIESRGYNSCDTANPRRVERAIEVRY